MAQPQQQQRDLSASDEWERMKQAAMQSDHDPFLQTEAERAIYAIGVATDQIDPTKSVLAQQGAVIDLTVPAEGIHPETVQRLLLNPPS